MEIHFSNKYNFIIGENAQGKTNILEGIYYSGKGKSFKQIKDKELIHFDRPNAYLNTLINTEGIRELIEVKLSQDKNKVIRINEEKIETLRELRSFYDMILFTPDEFYIIKGSKASRRGFLDDVISVVTGYLKALSDYNKLLAHRNHLMKRGKRSPYFNQQLKSITVEMVKKGSILLYMRVEYLKRLEFYGKKFHLALSGEAEDLGLEYQSSVPCQGSILEIQKCFYKSLQDNLEKDLYSGYTSVGPHRDDIKITLNGKDTKIYASQGQQRSTLLSLKLGQLKLYEVIKETSPLILLDDVFSELDEARTQYLLDLLKPYQSIITSVSEDFLRDKGIKDGKIFIIEDGKIKEEKCI